MLRQSRGVSLISRVSSSLRRVCFDAVCFLGGRVSPTTLYQQKQRIDLSNLMNEAKGIQASAREQGATLEIYQVPHTGVLCSDRAPVDNGFLEEAQISQRYYLWIISITRYCFCETGVGTIEEQTPWETREDKA